MSRAYQFDKSSPAFHEYLRNMVENGTLVGKHAGIAMKFLAGDALSDKENWVFEHKICDVHFDRKCKITGAEIDPEDFDIHDMEGMSSDTYWSYVSFMGNE